jgi:threonine/homoserine/homoserine lactone efflux protein
LPSIETLLIVTMAGLALSASPGPSMLYVLSRSIGHNRQAGYISAFGLAVGGMILAVATALGLSALLTATPTVFTTVQYLGAAYLVYLGVDMIWAKEEGGGGLTKVRNESLPRIFWQGVVVEVLNPKTVLFFLAFIPQFVDSATGSVTMQMLVLGILVPLTAIPSDIIVAMTGGTLANRIAGNVTVNRALKWLGGSFLVGLGVRVVLT